MFKNVKGKDNGVLLIVAPNERKVRIEVGRALESALTNSIAEDIINSRILPSFKEGDMASGVSEGAAAIIEALEGEYESSSFFGGLGKTMKIVILAPIALLSMFFGRRRRYGLFGGGGGFFGGSGGFSGGGGSSGGGGASGGW